MNNLKRNNRLAWGLLVLGLLAAAPAALAPAQANPEEDELDWGVGEASLVEGKYRDALAAYRAELKRHPGSRGDRFGLALTLFETGRYDEARALLEGLVAEFPRELAYRLRLAELLSVRGELQGAETMWRAVLAVDPEQFEAHARLGRLYRWRGQPARAAEHFRVPERAASRRVIKDPQELLYLGWCYWGLGRLADASEVLTEAIRDEEHGDAELYLAYQSLIELYLENHHVFGSRPHYMPVREEAFRNNPNHPGIHLVLADVYLARLEHPRAREALKKALAVNPNLVHGLCLEAYFAIDRMDFPAAERFLAQAQAINPVDKETIAYRASLRYILDDRPAAEKGWQQVLALDPHYGTAFFILADLLGNLRRYEEALRFARRAVATDPKLWKAWDALGRFALDLGREKEALEALRTAERGDPFDHPWRHNILELSSHLDEFLVHRFGPFRLRLHAEDNPVLRRTFEEALTEAWETLGRKYGFEPKGPIRVDVFSKQKDFAVRTVGVPGIHGVLGACFGQVITMNSPRALPLGSYVWKATLWHEFAHVITLQMSRYRVSRWLTEGLSVYEEKCRNPAWEDVEDVQLLNALENGRIVPVRELDGLFRSPRIGLAYLESLHLVEFIIRKKGGFARILEMLRSYARGRSTDQVLQGGLGVTPEELDREFLADLRERFAGRSIQPMYSREAYENARTTLDLDPSDVEALRVAAWYCFQQGPSRIVDCEAALGRLLSRHPKDPSGLALRGELALRKGQAARARTYLEAARKQGRDEFYLRLGLARIAAAEGKTDEAVAHLKAARRLFPRFTGPGNPYRELARLYRQAGDREAARREIEALVEIQATDVGDRLELAEHYRKAGDLERALRYLSEANQVNPYSVRIHRLMAAALAGTGRLAAALDEIDLAILLAEEPDPWHRPGARRRPGTSTRPKKSLLPDLRLERARLLRKMGREQEAEAEAEAASKKYPDHAGLKAFRKNPGEATGSRGRD